MADWLLLPIPLGLALWFSVRMWRTVVGREAEFRGVRLIQDLSGGVLAISLAGLIAAPPSLAGPMLQLAFIIAMGSAVLLILLCAGVLSAGKKRDVRRVRELIAALKAASNRALAVRWKRARGRIAPCGWLEFAPRLPSLGFWQYSKIIGVFIGAGYVLALFLTPLTVYFLPEPYRKLITDIIGYNVLFFTPLLTFSIFTTVSIILLLNIIGFVSIPIDIRRVLSTLALRIGYGTALGMVVASILPLSAKAFPVVVAGGSAVLRPAMLLEIPALSAVVFYIFGLFEACFRLWRPVRNLVYRRFIFPSFIYFTLVIAVRELGFEPTQLFEDYVSGRSVLTASECDKLDALDAPVDPTDLTQLFQKCGVEYIAPGEFWLLLVGSVLLVSALVLFFYDLLRKPDTEVLPEA